MPRVRVNATVSLVFVIPGKYLESTAERIVTMGP